MAKEFNITGLCLPNEHYMADVSSKLKQAIDMIEKGRYFIINRPRQYGKTTTLYTLTDMLEKTGEYFVINTSFEGVGDSFFSEEKKIAQGFISLLANEVKPYAKELSVWLKEQQTQVHDLNELSELITEMAEKVDKKLVLMIDEVDKSSNNQLFVSFLAMLRNKYLARSKAKTFHSVVLAGVHDVKSLKLKLRPDEEQKYNSPWNIASEFKVDMNLHPHEIKPMLDEYVQDKGVKMDTQLISERLFYYTSGYPFLVSKLCKMLDEDIIQNGEWTADDVEYAVQQLVKESNTNFDSLVKNLENNQELYNAVYEVAIASNYVPFNVHTPLTHLGVLHGIFVAGNGGGRIQIHNRIYLEVIVNYMTDKMRQAKLSNRSDLGSGYKNSDKTLNMEAVMLGFQTFMKKEYNKKDRKFLEKNGRLVFLAFIKPIINGSGYDFKEPQISEEKRLDVVITYLHQKFVAELKLWYGQKAHEEGLKQLTDYLDRQNLNEGYLLIFDHSEVKNWRSEWLETDGKKIFAVWV
jgi:Predicted AAA-ATPase